MRQILLTTDGATVAQMPRPSLRPGCVLVRVRYSWVSAGTETAALRPAHPDQDLIERGVVGLRRAQRNLRAAVGDPERAVRHLAGLARRRLVPLLRPAAAGIQAVAPAAGWAVGYSLAGEVLAVGDGVGDLAPGDRVAAAGAGLANHADYVVVPRNLVCRVPASCDLRDAAAATLGSIALQGVRRAAPQLGERTCVLGLGLVGQLTAQLLKAGGAEVLGLDPMAARVERARGLGLRHGAVAPEELERLVRDVTGGRGVDQAIVTASTPSDAVMRLALAVTRARGRVVVVGDVGLRLERADWYRKEIDLLMSTSYGPGRYDPGYETEGHDYPYAHVRWTLNRNLEAWLELLARGEVQVAPLVDRQVPLEQAAAAYAELARGGAEPLAVVLAYGDDPRELEPPLIERPRPVGAARPTSGCLLVGPGTFATAVLLPLLVARRDRLELRGVVSRRPAAAAVQAAAREARFVSTDLDAALARADVDSVVIATRHHEHADQVARALKAGKDVFVEKPLAIRWSELAALVELHGSLPAPPRLLVGFNRRFSPAIQALRAALGSRRSPLVIDYRINAGALAADHWTRGAQGGGRNLGEACHWYDLFRCLAGAPVASIAATAVDPGALPFLRSENFCATLGYADGSVATLTYTTLGPKAMAKEQAVVFCDGEAWTLDDYRQLTRASDGAVLWAANRADKGHAAEFDAWATALQRGTPSPIAFDELVETTAVALHVEDLIHGREPAA